MERLQEQEEVEVEVKVEIQVEIQVAIQVQTCVPTRASTRLGIPLQVLPGELLRILRGTQGSLRRAFSEAIRRGMKGEGGRMNASRAHCPTGAVEAKSEARC